MKRRELLKNSTVALSSIFFTNSLTGCSKSKEKIKRTSAPRVVVIGGGSGGISVAKVIKKAEPSVEVIVVERKKKYITCYGSNWTFNDMFTMEDITFDYRNLTTKHSISLVHAEVTGLEQETKRVLLSDNSYLEYDRLVVSPGISFRWDNIEGLDKSTTESIPHAWKAGKQTEILKSQINNMPDKGTFVMCIPPNPFRCPPGPYERASLIANYFKKHKPQAKIILLDAKDKFSKMNKFQQGWEKYYGYGSDNAMLEWVSNFDGGSVKSVDAKKKIVTTVDGEKFKADVINYIPTQKANITADKMGLVDKTGWCSIDPETFESVNIPFVHVIGDASISSMAKSAFAANSQASLCGNAVANLIMGKEHNHKPSIFNQCFSLITPSHGISVLDAFQVENNIVKRTGGGIFPIDGKYAREADSARAWYSNITGTLFN